MVTVTFAVSRAKSTTIALNDVVAWRCLQALKHIDTPPVESTMEEVEEWHFRRVYRSTNRSVPKTAEILGLSESTVNSRRRKYKVI